MASIANNLDIESLFSLEIVVERLSVRVPQCRFPAIAFRLLDYPTLMIYHVEPELGDKIKGKIRMDPLHKLGDFIPELLDKDGSFPIKKGKSCLLKISPNRITEHLKSTPLYLMLVDTFPETPKLLGNCTIPLDETMGKVYREILNVGLATPVVHGEKGFYKIYNLMGIEIGNIVLGIRILSLGVGLIPHIPHKAFAKRPETENGSKLVKQEKNVIQEQVAEIVLEDIHKAEHIVATALPPVGSNERKSEIHRFQIPTQTERDVLQNMATQTEKQKKKKQVLDIAAQIKDNVVDDIVVTNTVCPPPLFFNQALEPQHKHHEAIIDNFLTVGAKRNTEDELSEDDTIRHEDVSDEEYDLESRPVQIPKTYRKAQKPTNVASNLPQNLKDFPLLNAIVHEIMSLTNDPNNTQSKSINIFRPQRGASLSPVRSKVPPKERGRSPSPRRERESVENFVKRMQSPTHTMRELPIVKPTYDTSHPPTPRKPSHSHKCDHNSQRVPKGKSWLRKTPVPMEVKKTKLSFGLTNTQRLRLEKSNPELLKSIERKEQERVRRFKEQRRLEEECKPQPTRKLYTGESHYKPSHQINLRKPIPTPRHTLKDSHDSTMFDQANPLNTYLQVQEQYRYQYNMTPDIDVIAEKEQNSVDISQASDDKEIEYPSRNKDYTGLTEKPMQSKYSSPGFPVSEATDNAEPTNEPTYADDFEDPTEPKYDPSAPKAELPRVSEDIQVTALDAGEELGLRQYHEQFTDDEESKQLDTMNSESDHVEVRALPDSPEIKTPSPKISSYKPVSAKPRQVAALAKSNVTAEASVDSTAYISRSQVFGNQSQNSDLEVAQSVPSANHRVRRNTESVSSYEGDDFTSHKSKSRNYSDDSFNGSDDEDDLSEYAVPEPLGMQDLKISKDAKLGYTWA